MKANFVATILTLGLMQLLHTAQAFIVNVDAHNEECFFEKIEAGTKFSKNSRERIHSYINRNHRSLKCFIF